MITLTKSELLSLPNLSTQYNLFDFTRRYLSAELGHLNFKTTDGVFNVPNMYVGVKKQRLTTSMCNVDASAYGNYVVMDYGVLYHNGLPLIAIDNRELYMNGPYIYSVFDSEDQWKVALYTMASYMETVEDGFAYGRDESVLIYRQYLPLPPLI